MSVSEPLATYLELRESTPEGDEGAGLSHSSGGLVLFHVLELAAHGEPRGGVTIVHDAGDHGGRYLAPAAKLAEADLAVALPDMRGHGRSEGERGHSNGLREVLRDLKEVQQHLAYRLPIAPRVLVGQGLGALQALAFELEQPGELAGLVLLSPRWEPGFEIPKPGGLRKLFAKVTPTTPGKVGVDPAALSRDPAAVAAWSADELVHDVITARAAEQAAACAQRFGPRVGEASCPVLIVHGDADTIAPIGPTLAKDGPGVEVVVRAGARHDLLHESDADEVVELVRDWIVARL